MKVLVVGSLNMDYTLYVSRFPLPGETLVGKSRFIQPGGKGANQASAIAKSKSCETIFIGAVGNDNDGRVLLETLNNIGVDTTHIKISSFETGNATINVDSSSENEITIIPGANSDILPSDLDESLFKDASFVVLQNEIPAETNLAAMKLAYKYGVKVIYNPAPYRDIDLDILKYVDYFIPNEIELKNYSGKDDFFESVKTLLDKGVKNLIVTLGTKGSYFASRDTSFKVSAYKVKAVDTVAAGDTYVGYFVASLASGKTNLEAMDMASKASSITVTRKGSIVSIPFIEEISL